MQTQASIQNGLASRQREVRAAALGALLQSDADLTPHVEALAACLQDPADSLRFLALQLIARIGAPATDFIAQALSRKQPEGLRAAAAAILAGMGPAAVRSIPALCRNLPSANESLRNAAAVALAKIGAASVPALRLILPLPDPGAVAAALDALIMIGRPAETAVQDIESLAAKSPPQLQLTCAAALVCLTGNPERGLHILVNALTISDPFMRKMALEKIAMLGSLAHGVIPNVLGCTADPDDAVRAAAVLALGRTRAPHEQTLSTLISCLSDPSSEVRYASCAVLAGYETDARSALPALQTRLQDPEEKVAQCAAGAIRRIES